ncbi:AttF component of AttEFGH ABC transport system / AttG component of AttEFGH ABC transport system [Collimonas arenae]|uniref:AttF component of AttEFGH ABC transport system / AttG component of AttEFGH ABC transport system n=1 Tax=Collimonas arenae TaxID=279058 RepID=A0A0A1FE52_9BURK|nr:FtsX-like permease family protein [Collimonas arenae]AIY41934.1 AttF component of AttEFGH ABC transport system / AttG component of AttEFGH ABC transport system [Collimonas arenae]
MITATTATAANASKPLHILARWLLLGEWRAHPVRALVAIAAIALGVALGYAVNLINDAAFNEFSAATRSLSGQSDLQVRGVQAWLDEGLYPQLAQWPGVAVASPVLELNVTVPSQQSALKVLGIDVFRASLIAPDLVGVPAPERPFDTLADDAIFLSAAAQEWLQVKPGEQLTLRNGTGTVALRVAGGLTGARVGQRLGVMDIGAAQWRFDRSIGKLSRIDLKLLPGVNREAFTEKLRQQLPANVQVSESQDQDSRNNNMSRAYRINLNVLALVALFTGAFLVFSTQALSVIRRRSQFALLRVMGLRRSQLLRQVLLEGALLGCLGALSGLALGYGLAAAALHFLGGDLGGGYFHGVQASINFDWPAALVFFALGSGIAVLGSLAPAFEAAKAQPAAALKSGSEESALVRLATPWPALGCLLLGALLTQLPPLFNLPVFGYLAVALLLIGGITLMPRLAALAFSALQRFSLGRRTGIVRTLVLARLANVPGQASIALGGVLSSFSLIVAMAIMVSSFRISVDDWMQQLLSADLYVRSAGNGETGAMRPAEQRLLTTMPGVAHTDFLRTSPLALDPARPPVILIARGIDAADPARSLPIIGPLLPQAAVTAAVAANELPVWISEAMVDLYHYRLGQHLMLPLGGRSYPAVVAGVWRDYARQTGAIQLRLADYQRLSGDNEVSDAALSVQRGVDPATVIAAMRKLPFGTALEFSQPGEIRALTLKIFDRSFAITYLLEIVAIVIGLFGVAATFSAQTLARAREFGMLRHVGVTCRQILFMLALEGSLLTALGMAVGFLLGWVISLILVFIVNPQSFHWTMDLHMPWLGLAIVALLLLVFAGATALLAGLRAVSIDVLQAVREDW